MSGARRIFREFRLTFLRKRPALNFYRVQLIHVNPGVSHRTFERYLLGYYPEKNMSGTSFFLESFRGEN